MTPPTDSAPERAPREWRVRILLDRVLSASAGVVAASALAVSVYQAYISRQQLKMGAWPHVTEGNSGGGDSWAWVVSNVGLGPALVRSMRVDVDGKPVADWREFGSAMLRVDSAALMEQVRGHQFTTSTVRRGTVLRPGNATERVRVSGGPFAATMRRPLNDPRASVRFCYRSLYEDCWVIDGKAQEPRPEPGCPGVGALDLRS